MGEVLVSPHGQKKTIKKLFFFRVEKCKALDTAMSKYNITPYKSNIDFT